MLGDAVAWAKDTSKQLEDEALRKQAEDLAALEPELRALARQARDAVSHGNLGKGKGAGGPGPQPFPAQPSAAGARAVKAAHSDAYNGLH
jgi:hypothetical protein